MKLSTLKKKKETTEETFMVKEKLIAEVLKDQKAEKVVTIPLKKKSELADVMLIATGRSTRHVAGLADKVIEKIRTFYGYTPRSEGYGTGWVVIDDPEVIVHIFTPDERDLYDLEELWK